MFDDRQGFLTRAFLQREWALDYKAWGPDDDAVLLERLRTWAARPDLKERTAESPFVQTFFEETWGYREGGRGGEFTAQTGYAVRGAGAGGHTGEADMALGWFGEGPDASPQVLCEFKDIRSDLDKPQRRKGNTRSPVEQCLDYLKEARRGMYGALPVEPWWGLVTDMNEFRLYWWDRAPRSFLRFTIQTPGLLPDLLGADEDARFDRFLFARVFDRQRLLSQGGRPALLRLVEKQGGREKALEGEFYQDYRAVRERLFAVLQLHNPEFPGSPGQLLRLAQKILDRFIFAFYCEDMGERMLFPPQIIRDLLKRRSLEPLYEEAGDELWRDLKRLFGRMDAGGPLGQVNIRAFNGGLFRHDPQIEALDLPNHVFARAKQGANPASVEAHRDTVLHLCASYNYAARGEARNSITLYTLGRIFEQSITELEKKEAELDNRPSLTVLAKRKLPTRRSQGVYYTPEWVVERIVEGTLGPWFGEARAAAGWLGEAPQTLEQLAAYQAQVQAVRVVDPACGSGAFLIGAFRRLLEERERIEGFRATLAPGAPQAGETAMTADILDRNLFGVDLNGAAVEIAKLALWLHSARADAPLSSLDDAIKCGNSLVGPDYDRWTQIDLDARERERVNAFDWETGFPFGGVDPGRFDVVVGNPPYVKLQNLREVSPDVADYLVDTREGDFYRSTQTGNFDLYLPFIEKGLRLLRPGGRMGYIAPSLWAVNEYGEGLRALVREGRTLDRWVDFRSHQIFDEAITYTALQFFTAAANDAVAVAPAPGGEPDVAAVDWSDPELALSYRRLPGDAPWLLATGEERTLIDRLSATCLRLDDPSLTTDIFQGIKTGADQVYKVRRLANDLYLCSPSEGEAYEVAIENSLMKPILSGPEAKRYLDPETDTFLLFPYRSERGVAELISPKLLQAEYPKAWKYLSSWRPLLEQRDNGVLRDSAWYRFSRSQSLNRVGTPKLYAAGTVPELRFSFDRTGEFFLTGGRVDGIIAAPDTKASFLLAVLNGSVCNFVFQRIGRVKQGGWYEANKQFIAPLPIPRASAEQQAQVGQGARGLQASHTLRRDLRIAIEERVGRLARARHGERWLWPELRTVEALTEDAPARLRLANERRDWARQAYADALEDRLSALQAQLDRGATMEARFNDGELTLWAGGAAVIEGVYLDAAHGPLVEAYWRWLLLSGTPSDADRFAEALRRPPCEPATPGAEQFVEKVGQLAQTAAAIKRDEDAMNALLFDLYELSAAERALVLRG